MAMIRVPFEEMKSVFQRALVKTGFTQQRATLLAGVLAQNSLDGVESHGWNRFPVLIRQIEQGYVKIEAEPELVAAFQAWEQWDGKLGPGPLNAMAATNRAMELARLYGLGCVGLRNTNHWMRAGTYGQMAAQAGFALICWTNAKPTMPPYGSRDIRLGNNPLVIAVPRADGPVVLDIAMSQFSFGRMEVYRRRGEPLPVPGGSGPDGQLTTDAKVILETGRAIPIGYWKGSGLALLLDITAALLAGGQATYQIRQQEAEYGVSQVYLAFDVARPEGAAWVEEQVQAILADLKHSRPEAEGAASRQRNEVPPTPLDAEGAACRPSTPLDAGGEVLFPGERVLKTRRENLANGIPVDEDVWKAIAKR